MQTLEMLSGIMRLDLKYSTVVKMTSSCAGLSMNIALLIRIGTKTLSY